MRDWVWQQVVTTHASNITLLGMKVGVMAERRIRAARFCGNVHEGGQHMMAQILCL